MFKLQPFKIPVLQTTMQAKAFATIKKMQRKGDLLVNQDRTHRKATTCSLSSRGNSSVEFVSVPTPIDLRLSNKLSSVLVKSKKISFMLVKEVGSRVVSSHISEDSAQQ